MKISDTKIIFVELHFNIIVISFSSSNDSTMISKRRSTNVIFLSLIFISKCLTKNLLIRILFLHHNLPFETNGYKKLPDV